MLHDISRKNKANILLSAFLNITKVHSHLFVLLVGGNDLRGSDPYVSSTTVGGNRFSLLVCGSYNPFM